MKKQISRPVSIIVLLILLFSPISSFAANTNASLKNKIDSLKTLVYKCPTDSGKFAILVNYYWQISPSERTKSKAVALWAYDLVKFSSNLKSRSDGFDIRAFVYYEENKYDSAYHLYLKALNISKAIGYRERTRWSLYGCGNMNKLLSRSDSAIFYYKALANFEKDQPLTNSLAGNAFYFIIEIFEKAKQLDSAMIYKLEMLKSGYNNYERGFINEAMKFAENINDVKALSIIYSQIGNLYFEQNKYKLALLYYKKTLELSDPKYKVKITSVLNLIGSLYLEQGNDSLALIYTLKCMQKAREINNQIHLARSFNNLGAIYKHQGKYTEAINNFKMAYYKNCDTCPKIEIHNSLIGIADLYLKLNNRKKALEYYNHSLICATKDNCYDEQALSNLKMGNYYRNINESISEKYYLKAIELIPKDGFFTTTKTIADTLTSFAKAKHNYKDAFEYQSLSKRMGDSIQKYDQQAITAEWETRFEFEKLNNENKAKKDELTKEKLFKNGAILFSGLLIILAVMMFISYRRKKKDNQLLASQKEEIEKISQQLHEADQARLRFFTNISHELRTPLTLIIAPLVKLLKNETHEEKRHEYSVILRNSRKLQSLIGQLLDIAKIDKAELELDLKMHDFNKQLKVIASMFHSLAEEKNIVFTLTSLSEKIVFGYDNKRMEIIVNNLLSNAFKFTPNNGKITINIECENNTLVLKINDTGLGIPSESLEKVFDRFYQTDATHTRHFDGSGIGLALVKELVELHHGKISVKSEPEKWTEFTLQMPMLQLNGTIGMDDYQPSIVMENITSSAIETYKPEGATDKETILLVEDNNELRSYLSTSLSAKYNVIEAVNGTEGIKIAKKEIPDIIISDVMMPETDGYQLTSTLKAQIETSHIPIILLTAKSGRDSKIEGLERGADDYINKPFDEDELHIRVKNILQNRQKLQEKFAIQNLTHPSEIKERSMDEQFIMKLITIVENDLSNTLLDVEYLSQNIGLSRQQLYRKLTAISGQSPVEFIRSIRIKRAAQLISQKAGSISEIAFMTGFESLSNFSKRFKEEFGQLPSEYGKVKV